MTTIHTLHTTIQFPTEPGDDLLPALHTFAFLWSDLRSQTATWTTVEGRHLMLYPIIEYAADALDEERQCHRHYQRTCTFHRAGNSFLAAQWTNLSIQGTIATVPKWMEVVGMLSMVQQDAPEIARTVHPLLELGGRLLILCWFSHHFDEASLLRKK